MCVCARMHAQSHLSLCDPMDCSPPGSSVHGILQVRILEWVACPPPGDPSNPGIEPVSPVSSTLPGRFFATEPPGKPINKAHKLESLHWVDRVLISSTAGVSDTAGCVWLACRVALRKSFCEKPVVPCLRDLLLGDYGVRCDRLTKN